MSTPPADIARRQLARSLGSDRLAVGYTHDLPLEHRQIFARLEAIWSVWTQHALLNAFFINVETLSLGTGRL